MPDGTLIRGDRRDTACCDATPGMLAPQAALARLLAGVEPVAGAEQVPLVAAPGRVLAAAPRAATALPPFDQSAMDGFGLTGPDLLPMAGPPRLVRRIAAGDAPGPALQPGEAVRLLTGAPVPHGVAAVVVDEQATLREGRMLPHRLPRPGENLRQRGEDVAEGEVLSVPGTRLDARHVALFAAAGIAGVAVRRPVRMALLSNGNELRTAAGGAPGGEAAVHDSNRPMLLALLAGRPDIACTDLGLLPDDPRALAAALAEAAARHDLILTTGGISGSDADHLPAAIAAAGGRVEVLKLALKPGKPLVHGLIGNTFCLCLPGNPLAALVTMLLLGRPVLSRLAGAEVTASLPMLGIASEGFDRQPGREEYLPARITGTDALGRPLLVRAGNAGSARLKPLVGADGLLWLSAALDRVSPGEALRFLPFATAFAL